jgi:hypothetical protein
MTLTNELAKEFAALKLRYDEQAALIASYTIRCVRP